MSATNFRGGRKLSPKPSAFESEIHPPHKTSFCTLGISPLQGADSRRRESTVRKSRTAFIHAAQRTGAWMLLLLTATFWSKYAATSTGLCKSPCLRLSEIDSRKPPGYGRRFAVSRPMAAAHKENGGIRLSAKGKEKSICEKKFIYRNGKAA